eukprot:764636-Hanusia_phi.AAC.2
MCCAVFSRWCRSPGKLAGLTPTTRPPCSRATTRSCSTRRRRKRRKGVQLGAAVRRAGDVVVSETGIGSLGPARSTAGKEHDSSDEESRSKREDSGKEEEPGLSWNEAGGPVDEHEDARGDAGQGPCGQGGRDELRVPVRRLGAGRRPLLVPVDIEGTKMKEAHPEELEQVKEAMGKTLLPVACSPPPPAGFNPVRDQQVRIPAALSLLLTGLAVRCRHRPRARLDLHATVSRFVVAVGDRVQDVEYDAHVARSENFLRLGPQGV